MDKLAFVKDFSEKLFDKLLFPVDVTVREDNDTIHVSLEGEDLGGVIGRHGETLNNIQYVTSLACTKQFGEFTRVIVDAGNWREQREDQLKDMADRAMDRVAETQKEYHFPPLNAFERRIIHEYLSEQDGFMTESTGEGRDRHIVLKLQ